MRGYIKKNCKIKSELNAWFVNITINLKHIKKNFYSQTKYSNLMKHLYLYLFRHAYSF